MKENGMNKLIGLLNEWYLEKYEINPNFVGFKDYGGNDYGFFFSPDDARLMIETEVWTKKYGFIQRLVKNNKIDFSWEGKLSSDLVNLFERKLDNADGVIALLSISDTPIEDLISYLK